MPYSCQTEQNEKSKLNQQQNTEEFRIIPADRVVEDGTICQRNSQIEKNLPQQSAQQSKTEVWPHQSQPDSLRKELKYGHLDRYNILILFVVTLMDPFQKYSMMSLFYVYGSIPMNGKQHLST
jgi:hypothetical protein